MVYLITDGRYYKIGWHEGDDVRDRVRQLQTGHPSRLEVVKILDGGRLLERSLHALYRGRAVNSGGVEWFVLSREDVAEICAWQCPHCGASSHKEPPLPSTELDLDYHRKAGQDQERRGSVQLLKQVAISIPTTKKEEFGRMPTLKSSV